jgi:DNA-directed RNA polymerase specialized sigma subunit
LLYVESVARLYAQPLSLDASLVRDDGEEVTLGECIPDEHPLQDAQLDTAYARDLVAQGLRAINPRLGLVVVLRVLVGWSRAEVAPVVGVTPASVWHLEKSALTRMRSALATRGRSN